MFFLVYMMVSRAANCLIKNMGIIYGINKMRAKGREEDISEV